MKISYLGKISMTFTADLAIFLLNQFESAPCSFKILLPSRLF